MIDDRDSLFELKNLLFCVTHDLLITCFNSCQIGSVAHVSVNLAHAMNSLQVVRLEIGPFDLIIGKMVYKRRELYSVHRGNFD